jgi:hypothetical protein
MPLAALAEGDETRRERGSGEARTPKPHRDRSSPLGEPDVEEAMVEMAPIRRVDRPVVLEASRDDEGRVDDRYCKDEERKDEHDCRRGLEETLDGNGREDEPAQRQVMLIRAGKKL